MHFAYISGEDLFPPQLKQTIGLVLGHPILQMFELYVEKNSSSCWLYWYQSLYHTWYMAKTWDGSESFCQCIFYFCTWHSTCGIDIVTAAIPTEGLFACKSTWYPSKVVFLKPWQLAADILPIIKIIKNHRSSPHFQ